MQDMRVVRKMYRCTRKLCRQVTTYTCQSTHKAQQVPLTAPPSWPPTHPWNSSSRSVLLPEGTRPPLPMTSPTCLGTPCARCGWTGTLVENLTGHYQVCYSRLCGCGSLRSPSQVASCPVVAHDLVGQMLIDEWLG